MSTNQVISIRAYKIVSHVCSYMREREREKQQRREATADI